MFLLSLAMVFAPCFSGKTQSREFGEIELCTTKALYYRFKCKILKTERATQGMCSSVSLSLCPRNVDAAPFTSGHQSFRSFNF